MNVRLAVLGYAHWMHTKVLVSTHLMLLLLLMIPRFGLVLTNVILTIEIIKFFGGGEQKHSGDDSSDSKGTQNSLFGAQSGRRQEPLGHEAFRRCVKSVLGKHKRRISYWKIIGIV